MQRILQAAFLSLAVLAAGCGGGDDEAPLAETVKVKVTQARTADDGRLTITMTKFIDSRCPRTVTCVSAGSAVIDLTLAEQGRTPANVQMTLGGTAGGATTTYGSYRLEFTELNPYPESPVLTITDSEATLVVRRP